MATVTNHQATVTDSAGSDVSAAFNINIGGTAGLRAEYTALTKYYIDAVSGSDSNDGLSEESAFATPYKYAATAAAGSIGLFKDSAVYILDQYGVEGTGDGRSMLEVSGSGSAASPIVFANYPGHAPEFRRAAASGGATMGGSRASDGVIYDGINMNGNGGAGRIFDFRNNADDCQVRHCDIHNVVFNGGAVNYGLIYTHNRVDGLIIEYNNFYDMGTVASNTNEACLMFYQATGCTIRYNHFQSTLDNYWYRQKVPGWDGPSTYHDYYRNFIDNPSRGMSIWGGNATAKVQSGRFYENLVVGGSSWGMGTSESYPQNEERDWKIYNNTFIDSPIHSNDGSGNGPVSVYDTQHYNNICARTDGGDQVRTITAKSTSPFNYSQYFDFVDFNGYSLPVTADWNHYYQYNIANYDYATWQAREGSSTRTFDANSVLTTDPVFVNAAGGDYRLGTGSPFIGAGSSDGTTGGTAVDMGCFVNEHWLPNIGPSRM